MVAINVSRVCADAVKREKLTSGMQGTEVSFFFSADWDGLVKTAVFEGSGQSVDVLLTGASCEIPPAALKKYGGMLRVGVYGVSADGTTIIPTVYADLGIIRRGADPQKDPTTNSSLPVWAQLQAQIGDLSNLTTEDKTNLVAAINEAAKSGGGGGQTETEVQLTAAVSAGTSVTIDSRAAEQTVNLAWNVPDAKTIPAFTNYYIARSNIAYPRAFDTNGYTQTWSNLSYHGNGDAFVSGHTGTGTIKHLYCIDVTALFDAGTISSVAINYLAALFGGLDLVPGQDFAGQITIGTATLTIARGDTQQSVDSPASTATIKGGDVLSVSAGTVTFVYVTTKITGGGATAKKPWADKKWCAFGDSLTDPTINASTKYHAIIAEKTGISVAVLGKGGTGYYKTKDDGMAYYQRMANCPADTDVITIFGSVNDWNAIKNGGLTIGNPSDAMSAGTYSGYVNECIDVAINKAPYAQIALITPMDYHGLPDETLESITNALLAVAKCRKIKALDLYHTSGFRIDDATYAQTYTTDYDATRDTYGHPSNVAHAKLIAPAVLELLKEMMLYA